MVTLLQVSAAPKPPAAGLTAVRTAARVVGFVMSYSFHSATSAPPGSPASTARSSELMYAMSQDGGGPGSAAASPHTPVGPRNSTAPVFVAASAYSTAP